MIGLRLALAAIALMAVATAGMGGLAVLDDRGRPDDAPPLRLIAADDSSFWRGVVSGAEAAAEDRGIELQVTWPQIESLRQPSNAPKDECSRQRVGALYGQHALMPDVMLAADIMRPSTGHQGEADSCDGGMILHVTMANYSAGELCAETALEALPHGGTIAVLVEASPSKGASGRLDGFRDHLRKSDIGGNSARLKDPNVVIHRIDRQSPASLRRVAQQVQGQGVPLVIDLTGAAVEPLLLAFDAENSADRPRVVTLDCSDLALEAVEMGDLFAIVTPDPFQCGYQALSRIAFLQQRGLIEHPADGRGSIMLPPQVVRQDDVAEFRASRLADARVR